MTGNRCSHRATASERPPVVRTVLCRRVDATPAFARRGLTMKWFRAAAGAAAAAVAGILGGGLPSRGSRHGGAPPPLTEPPAASGADRGAYRGPEARADPGP